MSDLYVGRYVINFFSPNCSHQVFLAAYISPDDKYWSFDFGLQIFNHHSFNALQVLVGRSQSVARGSAPGEE